MSDAMAAQVKMTHNLEADGDCAMGGAMLLDLRRGGGRVRDRRRVAGEIGRRVVAELLPGGFC